ncbi:hypothetical protein O181_034544 [Austropuccinia psidii MF-1]|uniref:Vacuolar import and degradation protein 27 n=1 Tax=Austropuccinia psidii MF-1 TaxID=1389203 RepID=A0A9Q3H9M9_9BASI|nr:hypothetical protein [Austropuccinia psidii MF-1]
MFMVRKFFQSSKQDDKSISSEVISIPGGRLYLNRSNPGTKIPRECIYLNADLTIRRTSVPFNYQLIVERAMCDNEDLTELGDHEKEFLLDKEIHFFGYDTVDEDNDEALPAFAFSWFDLSSNEISTKFEFVVNLQDENCSKEKCSIFEIAVCQCMWERAYKQHSSDVSEEELWSFGHPTLEDQSQCETVQPSSHLLSHTLGSTLDNQESRDNLERETSLELDPNPDEDSIESDQSSSSFEEFVKQLRDTSMNPNPVPKQEPISGIKNSMKVASPLKSPQATTSHASASYSNTPVKKREPSEKVENISSPSTPEPSPLARQTTPQSASQQQQVKAEVSLKAKESIQVVTDAESRPAAGSTELCWSEDCDLYLFDTKARRFQLQENKVQAFLWLPTADNPQRNLCWLSVIKESSETGEAHTWISTNIGQDQSLCFRDGALIFNYIYQGSDPKDSKSYTWALRFLNDEQSRDCYDRAQEAFTRALFDRDNGLGAYAAENRANKNWNQIAQGIVVEDEDVIMTDGELEDDNTETSEEEGVVSSDEDEDEQATKFRKKQSGPVNSQLAVGYKEDLSFVLRGNMIGVFQNTPDNTKKLKFMASIPQLTTPDGKCELNPSKIMLHRQDSNMILRDPLNMNSLYNLDLITGKVVEEWKVSNEVQMSDFFARTKFGQTQPEATFLGTSLNSLFTIDPRLSGTKMVMNEKKTYASKTYFSCAATTQVGHIALGSNTGEVRLFDSQIGKNAKTLLPAIRDPIIGLDVTKDGRYLVATCKTYLLFVDCTIQGNGKNKGQLGFEKSFPKEEKPPGRRLELTPEHKAFIIEEGIPFCFTTAKFNQGPDSIEKSIVTSMGPYIMTFSMRKLKLGHIEYSLKKYQENIVADNFRWGNDKDIVVTMPSDVFIENRTKLSKPNRTSFAGNDNIVQAWNG